MFTKNEINKAAIRWSIEYLDIYENFKLGIKWVVDKLTTGRVNLPNCTRVEVIDENGRSYVNWKDNNAVSISIQDNGKTIKIFIKNNE